MKTPLFLGTATAMATPFFPDGQVDREALRRLVDFQLANGVNALVPLGTTGEMSTMTMDEWRLVLSIVINEVKGRVPVIAGTGGNDTKKVIAYAQAAKEAGADAQLCVTPYYNKTTQQGLIAHYTAIHNECGLPIILYNVPGRTGLNMSADTCRTLARLPRVIGIKEASGDVAHSADILQKTEGELPLYSGNDDLIVPLMSLGAHGVISVLSNIAPKQTSAMTDDCLNGRFAKAGADQLRYLPLIHALFSSVNPIPVKAALAHLGICQNVLRLPLVPLEKEKEETLLHFMAQCGVKA